MQIPFVHSSENEIGIVALIVEAVQLAILIGSIVPVEKALKRTFDENGVRRYNGYCDFREEKLCV